MASRAFLLVHGIGDFPPGLALKGAARALEERFKALAPCVESSDDAARTCTRDYRLDDGALRLSEYHWSGAFGKLRRLNPLRTLWHLLALFRALPALGAYGSSRPLQRRLAMLGGWVLLLSAVALTVGTIAEVAALADTNESGSRSGSSLASDVVLASYALLIVVVLGSGIMFLLSQGASARQSGRAAQWLGLVIGSLLLFAFSGLVFLVATLGFLLIWHTEPKMIAVMLLVVAPPFALVMYILLTIVDLLRDVVEYLAPSADQSDNPETAKIKEQVTGELNRLVDDGFEEITLVAHSLGSVIATEVLLNWQPTGAARPAVRLITCGSPLRRLIAPLLPNRGVEPSEAFERLAKTTSFDLIEWLNLYRVLDPVGQRLFPGSSGAKDAVPRKTDRLLRPRLKAPYGHSNYWGDPRFLEAVVSTTVASPGRTDRSAAR